MADLQLAITHKSESDHCLILNTINAANCKTQLYWWKWKYMSRAILCLNEIIVMIVTAPILMAKGVASNSILVTLAPLCLALGLTWAFEKSLPTSVALKANSRSHANGDIFRNAPPPLPARINFSLTTFQGKKIITGFRYIKNWFKIPRHTLAS